MATKPENPSLVDRMREELGLTRIDLAKELAVDYTTVYRWSIKPDTSHDNDMLKLALIGLAAKRVPFDITDPLFLERMAKVYQLRTLATTPAEAVAV